MERHELGRLGESTVGRFLEGKGYRLVKRNYRASWDEIDLIAENGDTLAFVEVKTRTEGGLAMGIEAVTKQKQKRILRCAQRFLMSADGLAYKDLQPRFDVAEVTAPLEEGSKLKVAYYRNAFTGKTGW